MGLENDDQYPITEENVPLRKNDNNLLELFKDKRVQLLLGKFLSGELDVINPTLSLKQGYRYPNIDAFIEDRQEAEVFLNMLVANGLLESQLCGILICCPKCGSYNIDTSEPEDLGLNPDIIRESLKEVSWRCQDCGFNSAEGELSTKTVLCYTFSRKGIDEISDNLVIKPLRDFLNERGYRTESPGTLLGESDVMHRFDIIAYKGGLDEGTLVLDFSVSDKPIGEEKVVAMFAKVYDTNPLRSVLVVFPKLNDKARKLAEQYRIGLVESSNVKEIWKKLREVIPPVEEFNFEVLDVMTLLSLPDHLRKTATIASRFGRTTAEEIAKATNRARAVESSYLNQLVRMGYLKKERSGRRVFFSVVL
jgi:transposase-like protein